eukprot:TRINITY_DN2896_c0_g2_i3.p1 TRINITY_DN2896_c0_g2~~TRINITY_DN2896_c0_g2_i3.p1  ORF type:complete len:87 (+),score=5.60 TRINITY_DN2896_c0_g2_i3:32-262(+)
MGRAHGSLAHVGQVRKNTPNDPKRETIRPDPRGRARMRFLYNRRFKNPMKVNGRALTMNSRVYQLHLEAMRARFEK